MIGYRAEGTIYNDHRSLQNPTWGSGGTVSPPADPGQSPGGGEAPRSSQDPKVYITKRGQKRALKVHF